MKVVKKLLKLLLAFTHAVNFTRLGPGLVRVAGSEAGTTPSLLARAQGDLGRSDPPRPGASRSLVATRIVGGATERVLSLQEYRGGTDEASPPKEQQEQAVGVTESAVGARSEGVAGTKG